MLSVADAQARLLALATPLPAEMLPIGQVAGRWLAEDVVARRSQPAADLSAMDGYAIRAADLPGPWRVIGESAAGQGLGRPVGAGEAARIFTGAPVPAGADTILIQEDADAGGDRLALTGDAPTQGQFVRPRGSDFAEGAVLLAAGSRLTAAAVGLAAIGGHATLPVGRRPRVALISTGSELVAPGEPVTGVQLPASNGLMLAGMLAGVAEVIDLGIVRDDLAALTRAFGMAAASADIVVTTGGASVGDHDLVRPALAAAGATLDFWKVALRPGKPLLAGRLGNAIALGLPGNPVSAFVTATLFLLPLIARLGGATDPVARPLSLPLATAVGSNGARATFLRAAIEEGAVRILPDQDSAALRTLAQADALVIRPPHAAAAPAGTIVPVLPIA